MNGALSIDNLEYTSKFLIAVVACVINEDLKIMKDIVCVCFDS